jgi:hypothetical protein
VASTGVLEVKKILILFALVSVLAALLTRSNSGRADSGSGELTLYDWNRVQADGEILWSISQHIVYRETVFTVNVEYEYSVGGEKYVGSSILVDSSRLEYGAGYYPVGMFRAFKSIDHIHYDPKDPSRSAVFPWGGGVASVKPKMLAEYYKIDQSIRPMP